MPDQKRRTDTHKMIKLPQDDSELLKECEVSTYRSSGAGGQHVNTTDSAVRVKHIPSGITVTCQESRSQHTNKATCLEKLRAEVKKKNFKPKKRVPTKKSRSAKERGLKKKKIQSDKKKMRKRPNLD